MSNSKSSKRHNHFSLQQYIFVSKQLLKTFWRRIWITVAPLLQCSVWLSHFQEDKLQSHQTTLNNINKNSHTPLNTRKKAITMPKKVEIISHFESYINVYIEAFIQTASIYLKTLSPSLARNIYSSTQLSCD